jgi:hypothetical protein
MAKPVIAIDFGGVLSIHSRSADSDGHYNTAIDMPHAAESLQALQNANFSLVLNSFCGKARAYATHKSLEAAGHTQYFTDIVFVRDKLNKGMVTRKVGASVMIDDSLDVLRRIQATDPQCSILLWFKDRNDPARAPPGIVTVQSWPEIVTFLTTLPTPLSRAADTHLDITSLVHAPL